MKNLAIVTGASSGTGALFAKALDKGMGGPLDEIWLVARREDRLNDLASTLKHTTRVFALDLTEEFSFDLIEKALADDEEVVNVQWLINNAGFGKFGDFAQITEEQNVNMVRLNCLAQVQMCYHCLRYMHAGSRIINMASVAAFLPQPYISIYAASKRFTLDFTRALDFELHDVGIYATAVCPKFMHTEFLADPGDPNKVSELISVGFEDPARVVRKAIMASLRGKDVCITSPDMQVANVLCKVLPTRWTMKAQHKLARACKSYNG